MNCFQTFSIKKPEMYIGTYYIRCRQVCLLALNVLDWTIVAELNVTFTIAHKFTTYYIHSVCYKKKHIHTFCYRVMFFINRK